MKSQTHTHTRTVFSQTSGFMNGGFREDSDCEELLLSRWVCVLWRADRVPSCCALWENSVNGRTCPLQWQHTHTELPPGTTAVLQVYYCSRRLMISHPLRIEVTETLIQDSLIIASGYFYLHSTCTLEVRSLRQNFVFVPVFFFTLLSSKFISFALQGGKSRHTAKINLLRMNRLVDWETGVWQLGLFRQQNMPNVPRFQLVQSCITLLFNII